MSAPARTPRDDLPARKRALRRRLRERWRAVAPEQRAADSVQLCEQVRGLEWWQSAGALFLFAPRTDEPDIWPLIEEALRTGRRVALPRFRPADDSFEPAEIRDPGRDIKIGAFGIREPVAGCSLLPGKQLDLTLVPGLAFGNDGGRLGRGKGYYDRLLPALGGVCCGVAMDWQVLPSIPAGPLDQVLNGIVTPTRWLPARPVR